MRIAILLIAATACAGTARNLETYRADTQAQLATRDPQLKSCYDDALKQDKSLNGKVTVQFVVAKDTGSFTNASVDPGNTTAPNPLWQCVLRAIDGLKLQPGDKHEGRATFVYEFKPQPQT